MRRVVASALVMSSLGFALTLHAQRSSETPPAFRAGIDVVQLDVTVLDKKGEPVPDLTATDFSVMESGKPRRIVAFSVMNAPEASPAAATWTRTVPLDVVTNQLDTHRLMVIVLDDRLIPAGMTGAAAKVATTAIDRLGPGDQAAILFTGYGQNQNFTTDHAALRRAVASLSPHPPCVSFPCSFRAGKTDPGVVKRIAGILQNAPMGRKILLSISPAPNMGLMLTDGSSLQDIRRALQSANITVYTFDLHGVQPFAPTADQGGRPMSAPGFGQVVFPRPNDPAVVTGGRAVVGTNDPEDGVENLFRDSRLYYLVGFERGAPADGELHEVSVKVNRPGVEVRTRSSYLAPKAPFATDTAAAGEDGSAADPLDAALARGMPGGNMPLHVAITPMAARDGKTTVLIVSTNIGRMPIAGGGSLARRVDLVATALDKDWHPRQTERQTVDVSQTDGASDHEILSRLSLAPGRYEVRVAAESEGQSGNVFMDVDVPDLAGPDLALSGVILSQQPGVPAGPRDALADLVPVVPATVRTFANSDHVTAFMRVYEGRSGAVRPVTVTTGIVNDQNARVVEHTAPIAASAFGSDRSADVSVDLPLGPFSRGDYVLAIAVTDGSHQQFRYERFSVN